MSQYKEIIDKMKWSFSRLNTFDTCKYCFYLNYIINDDDLYLSESNFYAEAGTFMHEILAQIFSGEMKPDDAARYFVDHFDENIVYKVKKSTMDRTFELCADYLSAEDFSWVNQYEILGVELKVQQDIYGYPFIGYIDLLLRDKQDGEIVVMDHKSASFPLKSNGDVKKNSEHSFEAYKKQMYLYCNAVKEKYGKFPKKIVWNHFKESRFVSIPFKMDEYELTMKWFIQTIKKIEREEEFEPTLEFFFCNNLCNFRASCEYCAVADWK